jgi:ABC-2 type transport system permease protein
MYHMRHLLKIEWLKLKNYRTFWILFILYMVAIIGANFLVYQINNQARADPSNLGKMIPTLYSFPKTWNMVTFVSTFLFLFPGLLLINHSCNEFNYKTSRQNIIDGISRKDYISVKLFLPVILSFLATIMVFLTGILLGYMASGSFDDFGSNLKYIFYFFLQTLVYCIIAVFIAHWVRRSGLALGIYFAYSLILENIIEGLIYWALRGTGNGKFSHVLPLGSSDSLIRTPEIGDMLSNNLSDATLIILSFGYAILFSWLSYRRFLKRDI